MTQIPTDKIIQMRKEGFSYSKIAAALDISINTVKSFCRRNYLGGIAAGSDNSDHRFCCQCGKVLTPSTQSKNKRFCSDQCRMS